MKKLEAEVPTLALTPPRAAAAIGVSTDFFDKHVRHELRVVRRGSKVLVAVTELQRWLDENGEKVLG